MARQPEGQAASCAFCGIVAGRIEASMVHEDAETVAFLDLRQPGWPRRGHVLVVPKTHVEFLFDLSDELAAYLMQTVVRVADAVRRVTEPGGISVWSSNGAAADQEVPHVHLHVLARYDRDRLLKVYQESPERPGRAELDAFATRMQSTLAATQTDPARSRDHVAKPDEAARTYTSTRPGQGRIQQAKDTGLRRPDYFAEHE